ncbi:hypothetical protein [Bifidobacterium mellis]|uniref:Uncharacterized protein n=1 Tax=Bifidobacterium mellis TaxID=1293823 RepID=A0A0F4KYA5_9BIFI|nr:hypothetical protein [Bifidobacterium mellis]KJY50301.1 hypothetical protein JF70_09940 [Bifidobacterium mellis]
MGRLPYLAQLKDVYSFGRTTTARSALPILIRRIILQSNQTITFIKMPGEEDTDLGGYDGQVRAGQGNAFVPSGYSVWEFGTSRGIKAKANSDYIKRTKEPLGINQSETTFVFVTLGRWADAQAWAHEKSKEGIWKEVRVYTADDILTALEETPTVYLWFSEMCGKSVHGLSSLETWWNDYRKPCDNLLTSELVLCNRSYEKSLLKKKLSDSKPSQIIIRSVTIEDCLAFVAATLLSDEQGTLSKAVVVSEASALEYLRHLSERLIVLLSDAALVREAELLTGHHIVIGVNKVQQIAPTINLPDISYEKAVNYFKTKNISDEKQTEYARAVHKSIPLLRNKIALTPLPDELLPNSNSPHANQLVRRAWMLGRWDGAIKGDADVVARFVIDPNDEELTDALLKDANSANPIFSIFGSVRAVISPIESAERLLQAITRSDLVAFREVVCSALEEANPALALPEDQRWAAKIYGKGRKESDDLRKGIATTLALLGSSSATVSDFPSLSFSDWAANVVSDILRFANDDCTGGIWISINDVLLEIAEAAPEEFLDELQRAISPSGVLMDKLFHESSNLLAPTSPHVQVLWALERLAMVPDYFGRAMWLLALLADYDPGGKLANRPLNSLATILRVWYPQTAALSDERHSFVQKVCRKLPEVGKSLVIALIPRIGESTSTITPFEFRQSASPNKPTDNQIVDDINVYLGCAVDLAESDPSIWIKIIPKLPYLPQKSKNTALNKLSLAKLKPTDTRDAIWLEFYKLIGKHQSSANVSASLYLKDIEYFKSVMKELEPVDPVVQVAPLFTYDWLVYVLDNHNQSIDRKQLLGKARNDAISKVFEEGGLESVLRLAKRVECPWIVGDAFACLGLQIQEHAIARLLESEFSKVCSFARSALYRLTNGKLSNLLEIMHSDSLSNTVKARLLLLSNEFDEVWTSLGSYDEEVEMIHWLEFPIDHLGTDFTLANEAAKQLASHGRIVDALKLLALYCEASAVKVDSGLAADLMEKFLICHDHESETLSSHEIEVLIKLLQDSVSIDRTRLEKLEWAYLRAFNDGHVCLFLHRKLADDPRYFADILSLVYPETANGGKQPEVPKEQSEKAWLLLNTWRTIPGAVNESSEIVEEQLRSWIQEVQKILGSRDLTKRGDYYIGKVLAYAPADSDGTWPCKSVCNIIEDSQSTSLDEGFSAELFNKRGAVSRSLEEGGKQEYELEDELQKCANRINVQWPKVAALLTRQAREYHSMGLNEDEQAKRYKEGIDY